jgi:hypothetical protein
MPGPVSGGQHAAMGDGDTVIVRLEVVSGLEPVTGRVHARDAVLEFSGWSELFAVLQGVLEPNP